jgi:hypothetical protein
MKLSCRMLTMEHKDKKTAAVVHGVFLKEVSSECTLTLTMPITYYCKI